MTEGAYPSSVQQEGKTKLRIDLMTPIDNTGRPIYLAGNFNDWHTGDQACRLQQIGPGHYRFEFQDMASLPSQLEYKYHRGNWEQVELDRYGNTRNNRVAKLGETESVSDTVDRWMVDGRAFTEAYLPKIEIITEGFKIPKLIKTRRITALLPYDYYETDKHYPVLYLQDGQNLFDDYAPFGSWGVDKRLAIMAEQGFGDLIVIAIDHAEKDRIAEFTPSYRTRLGSGAGKKYLRVLADRLKPYVDEHFRTLPDRKYTGIGGSSMGGLITIYAGLIYPEVYGNLMIFSPSLWVTPNIPFHFMNFYDPHDMRAYIYAGEGESENMVPNIHRFLEAFDKHGDAEFACEFSLDPKGQHNEARWGQEFPRAVEWLFSKNQA